MARDTTPRPRTVGVLPMVAGVTSALALAGAAVFTVGQAACEPSQYIRHDNHIKLVGGCMDAEDLPRTGTGKWQVEHAVSPQHSNYQP